jgi:hypothetical protein
MATHTILDRQLRQRGLISGSGAAPAVPTASADRMSERSSRDDPRRGQPDRSLGLPPSAGTTRRLTAVYSVLYYRLKSIMVDTRVYSRTNASDHALPCDQFGRNTEP